jgi:hypothetical protein
VGWKNRSNRAFSEFRSPLPTLLPLVIRLPEKYVAYDLEKYLQKGFVPLRILLYKSFGLKMGKFGCLAVSENVMEYSLVFYKIQESLRPPISVRLKAKHFFKEANTCP